MIRLLLVALLFAVGSSAAAQSTTRPTSLFAEVIGSTGAYALGIEHAAFTAADQSRQLRLRLGAAYWEERTFIGGPERYTPAVPTIAVPFGAVALFSLGHPVGLPSAFEFGAGAVFVHRSSPHYGPAGERFWFPIYAEAALRTALSDRVAVRAGIATGGESSEWVEWRVLDLRLRPVLGVGFGL